MDSPVGRAGHEHKTLPTKRALVRYLTRFTEECFASLIALIFIYESFKQLAEIATLEAPMRLRPKKGHVYLPHCFCDLPRGNLTDTASNLTTAATTTLTTATTGNVTIFDSSALTEAMCKAMNLTWKCESSFVPDVFLMSVILFATTFFVAIFLVDFRAWPCFPTFVRNIIGDFAILIAILVNVGIDAAVGLPTPKLTVPSEFKPTKYEARGWFINPISDTNPWWLYIAAGLPALLATILIFMDQHITAVIVNRAEHKLKGSGYHLDLLVVGLLVAIHSFLGLPWYVAATVNAIAHINSLKKVSECAAPGEKPTFLGVREQRVTAFFVGVLSGAAVFITNILKVIPMPVLYGVFFYMGWSALGGMQLIDRILLIFMPIKYQPDYKYLRHVPLWRVHVFTVIQILCLVALWVVKSVKSISIIFPLLVVFTGVVRKIIECFFTETELKYLDSLLPPIGRKKHDRLEAHSKESSSHHGRTGHSTHDKASFFLNGDRESPPAYDNKGFDTKL
ncbi:hypothetical protein C0Q70_10379 [Pomacea canaliculata]|uniref:Bicarbonate transporter-like transmembrane domain-containing protein n=1 Tax=Pomacea canaliculata TaxID=400727 RepID=A0A2T7PCG6_POMCA|nr:hypothetical protein C0Q70_10379 [Pomacea canaliculata]